MVNLYTAYSYTSPLLKPPFFNNILLWKGLTAALTQNDGLSTESLQKQAAIIHLDDLDDTVWHS